MTLALVLLCLYVILRRSGDRARTARRMGLVFGGVLAFAMLLGAVWPRFADQLAMFSGIVALSAALLAGLFHAHVHVRVTASPAAAPAASVQWVPTEPSLRENEKLYANKSAAVEGRASDQCVSAVTSPSAPRPTSVRTVWLWRWSHRGHLP